MLFSSYSFLFFFLPTTLVGFGLLSRHRGAKAAKIWLVLASLFFYGWWNPVYVGLIVASMMFNFSLGRHIGQRVRLGWRGEGAPFFWIPGDLARLGFFLYV